MSTFHYTTHISLILERSEKTPVVIFKYSSSCSSSEKLRKEFEKSISEKKITYPVFMITVQDESVLSKKVAERFGVKHESPQILLVNKGKLVLTEHHSGINLEKLSI